MRSKAPELVEAKAQAQALNGLNLQRCDRHLCSHTSVSTNKPVHSQADGAETAPVSVQI